MALAEKLLAAEFNRPGLPIVDHRTYAFLGDGCLMEGISHEVCSLAGVWKLGKLVCFYDDNGISIDGKVTGWFADDTAARFRAYGWNVIGPIDGHDAALIDQAIRIAHTNDDAPTLVICRTTIGWGSPKMAGTHEVHGAPLGGDEAKATRAALGWEYGRIRRAVRRACGLGRARQGRVGARRSGMRCSRATVRSTRSKRPPSSGACAVNCRTDWPATARAMLDQARGITAATATRKSSQQSLETLVAGVPELLGGSADLTWSNLTAVKSSRPLEQRGGNYLHFGVREFGMAAIMNGAALHGGFIPYGGTFAVFSDYARSGIRMSALMKQRVVYVLTHDSIGLGEDGPTHQPVEHATALRVIPESGGLAPVRWRRNGGGVALRARTRRRPDGAAAVAPEPATARARRDDDCRHRGRRLCAFGSGERRGASAVIIATGSEVAIALDAQKLLAARGIAARVVSMPSTTRFDAQSPAYQRSVLPPGTAAGRGRGRDIRTSGASTSGSTGASSASPLSANLHRPRRCTSTSA